MRLNRRRRLGNIALGMGCAVTHLGSVPAWDPSQSLASGTLTLWLDANTTNYQDTARTTAASADGDPVGSATDRSGNGFHGQQGTAGAKPTLKLAIQNGLNVFRFDGGDYVDATFSSDKSQPNTLFAVSKVTSYAATRILCDGVNAAKRHYQDTTNVTGVPTIYGGSAQIGGATAQSTSAFSYTSALFNTTSSQLWLNGVSQATGSIGTHVSSGIRLGGHSGGAFFWLGDIAEFLFYAGALSTTDRQQVESYLRSRYAL